MDLALELWQFLSRVRFLRFVAESDRPTGWNGIGQGIVDVTVPSEGILIFTESGSWRPTGGRDINFSNVYRWTMLDAERVRLEHLRFGPQRPVLLFEMIPDPAGAWIAATPHECGEDCYTAELRLREAGLSLHWVIAGPNKSESIKYEYRE